MSATRLVKSHVRLLFSLLCLIMGMTMLLAPASTTAQTYQKAVWIPVDSTIERGLESFLERAFADAQDQQADLVILHINTPGGEVNAADQIGQLIRQAPMHVIAYIDNQAFSAGTYIALNANEIIMTPGSSMGAAAPIDLAGNAADIKFISGWSNKMKAAAELNNRNPDVARAMVEIDTEFPGLKPKGTVLSLDAQQAKKLGYADDVVSNKEALLKKLGIQSDSLQAIEPTGGELVARWVTSPIVMSLLLVIGLGGIVVELFAPGFGVAGTISLVAFSLYFFGHYVAGFANWLHIGLFAIGILLMLMEIFLPGGIVGAIGFVSIVTGLVMAAYDTQQGLASLGVAALITAIVTFLLVKKYGVKGLFNKFVLGDTQRNEEGYVAPRDQRELEGKSGIALTTLRPAGVVKVEGKRVDAVSVGGFIEAGTAITVVQVEGTRIVVAELEQKE
ncbi:NfeD family protein [Brevibacillus porteri]|uniref:Serine protease n=1 Tax=Brevibacillus porteri TaxID=2126350 RepID=A0ABX5FNV3_9BACL|nr:nodulation protein NfeD [Brevibacillus porteri]MED1802118.1 nodulation protein NfeD [Brevibacillus porteri]MED2129712.1 nodulation protein NfeD [Brevibacillus porteri]MED2743379.1 nodulation protein NfeD [Brevibacillus porteri]MED2817656.1 nodulation protein NfeD [Brevibacillus porteri]MED2897838.1 nodulation protein NfeD [Brevibacillus porteri]